MDRTNGRTWWRILLATGTFAVWAVAGTDEIMLGAGAGEIVLGAGETHVFTNAEDAVQAEAVRLADRTVLEKRGAGTLTLRGGTFTENQPVTVHVREGAVSVVSSEPLVTAYAQPTEVMNRAAFWVDAERNVQLRTDGEAENEVAAWLDVRETGDGGEANPYLYTRAVAFTNEWLTAFPLAQSYLDKPGVYCRGSGSGCFLNWVKPDGTQQNIEGLRHVFVVHGGPTSAGHILGQRSTAKEPYFQRSGKIWADHNGENKPLFASRTYLNGQEIDPFPTSYPANSLHVVEVEALGASLGAMCFYNDRDMQLTTTAGTTLPKVDGKAVNVILGTSNWIGGGDRVGGEYIYEALLFTNDLTVAERLAVSDWLNQKWRGTPPPATRPATTVALATNAVFEVTDGTDLTGITLSGGGVLRKTGAGAATLRSSYQPRNAAPRVQVEEGVLNLGAALPLVCAAGDTLVSERRPWGPELAPPEAGADTARLVKRGSGPVLLDAVPEGVTHLRVEGGELRLADPERARDLVPSAAETVEAVFPDADFETYPATGPTTAYSYIKNGEEANGWHAVVPGTIDGSTAESSVFFFDQRLGSPSQWYMVMQSPPTGVLAVKNNASVWCEIDIPSDGDYTLSFRAAPRGGHAGEQLDVMIGPDAENLVSFGSFSASTEAWRTFAFTKLRLTAGRYQFWLKAKVNNRDRCTQFDDFRLVREADAGEWALPNGGFEEHTADFANAFTLANAACVPGFTVKQCERENNGTDKGGVSSNTTFSVRGTDNHAHFNLPWNRVGSETQLYMSGIGPQLTTTFTPPAGTWLFRADFCCWATTWGTHGYKVAADLQIGGTAVALGTVTNHSYALLPRTWPGTFTVDGATPVTLTLTGGFRLEGQRFGHGILDNLTLVRATGPGENLFQQGGFESMAPWQVTVTPKPDQVNGSKQQMYDGFYETFFGLEAFEGKACVKIVNDDTVAQTVTFPTGGLYRLSANLESRNAPGSLSFGNGLNPVAFFCARGGVTNWLGVTDTVATTNFHEYAYLVRIPEEGGTYDVGFRGRSVWGGEGTPTVDRTTLIDAAQLYRVETARPLDLPETLEIDVAAGAQLTLDFDGTNEVRRLNVAGRNYVGYVSLAERPELLGTLAGRGTLFIRPRGTVLILR